MSPITPPGRDPAAPRAARVRVCALTDVGRTREHNEDAFLVGALGAPEPLEFLAGGPGAPALHEREVGADGLLCIVADGLGGAAAGEVASHMAVRAVFDALREQGATGADDARFATALRDAALAANQTIHHVAARNAELRGMGTTLTAAALHGGTLFLAQVGDSRAYLVRGGEARQLTKDQSLMQRLLDAGEITPEQAETSARRNIILQALGPEPAVKVDLTHQRVRRGDVLVLCSDGLSGQVRAGEIAEVVAESADLAGVCMELVRRANEAGGPDNITVVAARFEGDELGEAAHDDEVGHRAFPVGTPTPEALVAAPEQPVRWLDTAGGRPPAGARPPAAPPAAPGVSPHELAERRDRARLVYAALAAVALVLAVVWVWQLVAPVGGGAGAEAGAARADSAVPAATPPDSASR